MLDLEQMSYAIDGEPVPGLPDLFPYQRGGVAYLGATFRSILGDAMGLGKTVQSLGLLRCYEAWPAVVVAPASLVPNWKREINRWLPGCDVEVLGSESRHGAHITLTSYERMQSHLSSLKQRRPVAVVIDEAHYTKTPQARRTRAARELAARSPIVVAATGTPVLNRPDELASLLELTGRIDEFGGRREFMARYGSGGFVDELQRRLRQTGYIRREKAWVLDQLPPKRPLVIPVTLRRDDPYFVAERDTIAWIAQHQGSDAAVRARRAEAIVRLNVLRQLAAQAKLPYAIPYLQALVAVGEQVLTFAHHTEIVKQLVKQIPRAGAIAGEVSPRDRQALVDRFQRGELRLLVLSLGAGGVGLTLTAATQVVFVEYPWTPALVEQAEDRAHRIGQENPVVVTYLMALGTVDIDVLSLLDGKRWLVDDVTTGVIRRDRSYIRQLVGCLNERTAP